MAIDRQEVEEFIYREARLQDEGLYEEWEALWTDDAHYWVPANGDDVDPDRHISIINDNRTRISTRVRQLSTGERHSQAPPSRMRHLISNIETREGEDQEDIEASSNFMLVESRSGKQTIWAGRTVHRLRREDGRLKMSRKKVMLVNNYDAIPTMSFLV